MGFLVAIMDDEVANVRNPRERIPGDHDGMLVVKDAEKEKQQCSSNTQIPEQGWHGYLLLLFRNVPLDDKTREKDELANPANDIPNVQVFECQ